MALVDVGGIERGLAELSDTLSAIAAKPDNPDASSSALIRLMRMIATLAEPDDVAAPV